MLSKISTSTAKRTPASGLSCQEPASLFRISSLRNHLEKAVLLLNSLSLDAPLVAVTWLWCLSKLYFCPILMHHYFILFSVTWLAYSGDRLLDTLRMPGNIRHTPRHQFTSRHFKPLLFIWSLTAISSVCVLLISLSPTELIWGLILLGLLSIYFISCFYIPQLARRILTREFLVGLFFSSATHFFILVQQSSWSLYILWSYIGFLSICTLNCLAISRWEFASDMQAQEVTFFTSRPARLYHFQKMLLTFLGLLSGVSFFLIYENQIPTFELCLLLSTLMLIILDRSSLQLSLKPVLADLALLTPWLVLSIAP
ncbi:hypothetical protein Pan153_60750 [Gimesia panareensis]|uniref:Prenyltransferase n=1 Tax=Gimesia panareensis TaxID=2527978 RepID=A0A518FYE7_9PLAN|nr:hypothetical protein Pan153_60750 [Gimesia panareensis]